MDEYHDRSILYLLIPLTVAAITLPAGIALTFTVLQNGFLRGLGYIFLTIGAGSLVFLVGSVFFLRRYRKKYRDLYRQAHRRKSSTDVARLQEQKVSMLNTDIAIEIEKERTDKLDKEQLPVFKLQPPPKGRKKKKQHLVEDQGKTASPERKQDAKPGNNNSIGYVVMPSRWKHTDNVRKLSEKADVNTYKSWKMVDNVNCKEYMKRCDRAKEWKHVDNVKCKRAPKLQRMHTYSGEERKEHQKGMRTRRADSF